MIGKNLKFNFFKKSIGKGEQDGSVIGAITLESNLAITSKTEDMYNYDLKIPPSFLFLFFLVSPLFSFPIFLSVSLFLSIQTEIST